MCGFGGTIVAVGDEVQDLVRVGDAVIGWNLNSPSCVSHLHAAVYNTSLILDSWSLPCAAAMVVPLLTGYHSIVEVARLRNNQSILVHGGTGIYGYYVMLVARCLGAKIFVTVATAAEKAEIGIKFNLPSSQLLYDRELHLTKELLDITAGKGVDVVLAMPDQVAAPELGSCIAPFGTYVQLSHKWSSDRISLPSFSKRAVTFTEFDLQMIASHLPMELARTLQKAVKLLADGAAKLAEVNSRSISQIEESFAEPQALRSLAGVVLTANEETTVKVRCGTRVPSVQCVSKLRSDATYVIAGGFGNLGQQICSLMARTGARHIMVLSRRSPKEETIDSLRKNLRQVSPSSMLYSFCCDISDHGAVRKIAKRVEELMLPPVRGLIQSATVLHDRVLEKMTIEDWQIPLQTKMYGTRNLHEIFSFSSLDFFFMLSSLSGIIGTRGQANYAAGNTYQDAFPHTSIQPQTACISLDLGMIEDSTAYQNATGRVRIQSLLRQGLIPIKSEQFIKTLEWALSPETWKRGSAQCIIGINGPSILEAGDPTPTTRSAMFSQVRGIGEAKATMGSSTDQNITLDTVAAREDALELITEYISQKVSDLLGVDEDAISRDKPLSDVGMDSLTAIEVKNFIHEEFDATIHASEILDEPSLISLGSKVTSRSAALEKRFRDSGDDTTKQTGSEDRRASRGQLDGTRYSSHHNQLPPLPLPNLPDTMEFYLNSAKSFLSAQDFQKTAAIAQSFQQGVGRTLQCKIETSSEAGSDWHYKLQIPGVYLRRRLPIYPFGTFYGVHLPTDLTYSQTKRAAIVSKAAYMFKKRLEAKELEQDFLNEEPICARSLESLFHTCREPRKYVDRVTEHEGRDNDHIVVLRRGHVFRMKLEERGQLISSTALMIAFENILRDSKDEQPSVATLTADERDSWADNRALLKSISPLNDIALQTIEAAAFGICLDDTSPMTPTERCNPLVLGHPGNRWSDKSLQFVVFANGESGFVCEHSMLDAFSLRQISTSVVSAICEPTLEAKAENLADTQPEVEELKFDINKQLMTNIDRVQDYVQCTYKPIEFVHYTSLLGKSFFRKHTVPMKAGIQVVLQLASFLYYGALQPSWETLTTMPFRHGRLDWMQSMSSAMSAFCESAFDESLDLDRRSTLLREATSTHTSTMARISRGRGFAAHLEALWEIG